MHLVSPTSFRLGKTLPWRSNVAYSNNNKIAMGSELSLSLGFEKIINFLLLRNRLFIIRGVVRKSQTNNVLHFNLLFVPRMKEKPRDGFITNINSTQEWLYSNRQPSNKYKQAIYAHFENVRKKRAKMILIQKPLINKWISKQMFRGISLNAPLKTRKRRKRGKRRVYKFISKTKLERGYLAHKKYVPVKFNKKRKRRNIYKTEKSKKTFNYLKLNNFNLSYELSALTHRKIKVRITNIFVYLVKKGLLSFKNHQKHFWNSAYRGRRWNYSNYWDLLNSFYLIGTIKHTETFLLTLLCAMLPRIEKLRRVFYFLDSVIKNLPQITKRFGCFRMTITGKLAGGTKRTKQLTIGYGRLVVNSLSEEIYNNFICFAHRYGAFGIKLIMSKNYPIKAVYDQQKSLL